MRKLAGLAFAGALVAACATGVLPTDSTNNDKDGGVSFKDSGSTPADSGTTPQKDSGGTTGQDSGVTTQDSGTTCTQTICNQQCVDTSSDNSNCGQCNNACPSSATCQNSKCVCGSGTLCSNTCVDTSTDNSNCGKCGTVCTSSQTCMGGTCTAINQAPPQGSCAHSLCSTGTYLDDFCDTSGCAYAICDIYGDSYCCTSSWDSLCVSEVATNCSPYTCN